MRGLALLALIACGAPPPAPPPKTNRTTTPTPSVRDQVLAVTPHVLVMKMGATFTEYRDVIAKARALDPAVVVGAGLALFEGTASSAHAKDIEIGVRGEDPAQIAKLLRLQPLITHGSLRDLQTAGEVAPILLGHRQAIDLGVQVGDSIDITIPGDKRAVDFDSWRTKQQEPLTKAFRVVAIYQMALHDFDRRIAYTTLAAGQEMLERGDHVSAVELGLSDPDRADDIAKRLEAELGGPPYQAQSWNELNKNILGR